MPRAGAAPVPRATLLLAGAVGQALAARPCPDPLGSLQQFLEKLKIQHIHLIDIIRNIQLPECHFPPFTLSVS